MSTPVLVTKLFVPPTRTSSVPRPRLIARLNEGVHHRLTLIAAPAGFGKTTLVSEWASGSDRPTAWLSLDESDNDPTRFLAYLVAALKTITPDFGAGVLGALHSPQPLPTESILTALINEISALPDDFVLVLDDYHLIDARPVDDALTFLLEHLPPQMHLVIVTREDPPLPLARFRARDQLIELRAADLRFTADEAAEFLGQAMGLNLSAADISALEERTEGWIAGLQLAALSVQGHENATHFIQSFTGSHHFVLDYLVDEVLQRQTEPVRQFLLQTAILDRLNGPLCDAVTGQTDGSARLEAKERGNFFVIPLDEEGHWYRYHHLFADVLYKKLMAEQPDQVATLHRRASAWYEQHGLVADAIRHTLAAEDFARAATLVELALPEMRRSRQGVTVLGWIRALPDELIRCRPVLSVGYAWALLAGGELEAVEARLRDAERWLDRAADERDQPDALAAEMIVVDDEEFRRLPGTIAVFRAGHAQMLGDVPATMTYARQVLDLVPDDDHLRRGAAAALLGLAYWANGELEAAHRHYAAGMERVQRAGHFSDLSTGAIVVADIRRAQGRLRDAERALELAVQRATERGEPSLQGTADLFVGLSELQRERNDLHAATQHLLRSKELGERTGLPQDRSRWCVAMARLREAQADLDGALDLLDEAERLYVRGFSPYVLPVPALKARVWVAQGRLAAALEWAREQRLSAGDDLSYLREFEHLTLARVLLAGSKSDTSRRSIPEAMGLLDRLLEAAEAGGRTGSILEILVLQARACQYHGDFPAALVPLERALALAEPEGYVRLFVDEGPPMAALLEAGAKRGIAPNYVHHLLTAFGEGEAGTPTREGLIEPLSERELEVLRMLGTDLDGPEIARELVVSLNTLRTHTKNIYGKLGVSNRRAAVRRGEELELLSRTRRLANEEKPAQHAS